MIIAKNAKKSPSVPLAGKLSFSILLITACLVTAAILVTQLGQPTKKADAVHQNLIVTPPLSSKPDLSNSPTDFFIKFKKNIAETKKISIINTIAKQKAYIYVNAHGDIVDNFSLLAAVTAGDIIQQVVSDNSLVSKTPVFSQALSKSDLLKKYPERSSKIQETVSVSELRRWESVQLAKPTDIAAIIQKLKNDPAVETAAPSYFYRLDDTPNDYYYNTDLQNPPVYSFGNDYPDQYGPKLMQTDQAWDNELGNPETILAIVDTGVDYTHPDLQTSTWINSDEIPNNGTDDDHNGFIDDVHGWDFGDSDNNPTDGVGHGTHVAGIIAATTNNSIGMVGLCRNCKVMPIKAFQGQDADTDKLVGSIIYAVNNGATVINNSWGGLYSDPVLNDAIHYATGSGVIPVFAAGNEGMDANHSQPRTEDMIIVSATDWNDQATAWTNFGSWIDVAAPGANILSTKAQGLDMYGDGLHIVGDNYYYASGTSFSAPHAVGLIGLVLSQHPEFNLEEVRQVLRHSAQDINTPGWDATSGYGRVNAQQSLQIAHPCVAKITAPANWSTVDQNTPEIDVRGTAACINFRNFILEYGRGEAPVEWTEIVTTTTPVTNGILKSGFSIANLPIDGYVLRLRVITAENESYEDRHFFQKAYPLVPGFPVTHENNALLPPQLADINNDASGEIFWGVAGWSGNGAPLPGRPVPLNTLNITDSAIGELFPEFYGQEQIIPEINSRQMTLHIYCADGQEIRQYGWPKTIYIGYNPNTLRSPLIADIDENGTNEILLATNDSIHVWNKRGQELSGWPATILGSYTAPIHQLTLGNFTDDPGLEIAIPHWSLPSDGYASSEIIIINQHGQAQLTFDLQFNDLAQIAAGDLDHDNLDELVIANSCRPYKLQGIHYPGCPDQFFLYALNGDGTAVPGWPQEITSHDPIGWDPAIWPSLGDVNNDGWLDVSIASGDTLFLFNHDGTSPAGWPKFVGGGYVMTNPLMADVNSDGLKEIIVNNFFGQTDCYTQDGTVCSGFPVVSPGLLFSSPAINDINSDGRLELITVSGLWNPIVSAYSLSYSNALSDKALGNYWYMSHHDAQPTGRSGPAPMNAVCGDVNVDEQADDQDAQFLVNYFKGIAPAPIPAWKGDVNGDGQLNGLDVTFFINYLGGGPALRCQQ